MWISAHSRECLYASDIISSLSIEPDYQYQYHLTTYPSSPQLTYDMTTDCNKSIEHLQITQKNDCTQFTETHYMLICKLLGSVEKFIVRALFLITLRCFVILFYQLDFLIKWFGVILIIELPVQRVFVVYVVSLLLFAFQSMFILIWVSRLEIAEFTDSIRRSAL